ncbi:bifunctional bis(5'-adenosyl)-triphosphatase/adenylylsulfatase FHIT-like [Histomonas meleagridis]|uniref:bifunctional bis(5'-adenosyl)-triphosphatase/adenylylsulfatase FHIT-like n=1 Tax=Histomonas meleagridis TaxID=135588 RepID=UPI00355A1EFA|nr:bifunctional bis(5'-adenosyl)-triphosphatase/adenylylsulfatase FHIT-like [Histomonas meleagridis]KAH0804068.1 bifunctional bis(5'-adenosyl)-triphosphatase/adenylylsulfatase FHIT-like [Histomonas meleagridis]
MSEKFGPFTIPENHIIKKTKLSYVFTDLRPAIDGHILVSPLRSVQFFEELTQEEKIDLTNLANISGHIMKKHLGVPELSITIQNGPIAGQTVPHVHMHIIPRTIPAKWLKSPNLDPDVQAQLTEKYKKFFEEEGQL